MPPVSRPSKDQDWVVQNADVETASSGGLEPVAVAGGQA